MKKLLLLAPLIALASCTSTQPQKPYKYKASSTDVIAAIAEIAPSISPGGAINNLGVSSIEPNRIVLESGPGLVMNVRVIFTALETSSGTIVTHSYPGDIRFGSPIDQNVRDIYKKLSARFPLVE
ncbi:hypothetical protein [Deinococcus sp. 12RED42]|uniref:hypothetical protein n=1 Tax=Deinococcus sp. 12RED42 TaxID=2745872 RepID=UPI001E5E89B9|nr:hypothetical protein [Deinococcus sp. 12RED42]MCD0165123.1 hypothetical protein [Deinococcus sp. 12RED42]